MISPREIARRLENYPLIRQRLKYIYFRLGRITNLFSRKNKANPLSILNGSNGYYDISPWDPTAKYFATSHLINNNLLRIDILSCNSDYFPSEACPVFSFYTEAWNHQQFSLFHWLSYKSFVFNNLNNNNLESNLITLCENTGYTLQRLSIPTSSILKTRQLILAININRINEIRPEYGFLKESEYFTKYNDIAIASQQTVYPFEINQLISFTTLIEFLRIDKSCFCDFKVNHITPAPNEVKILFMLRYFKNKRKYSRLISYDFDLDQISEVPLNNLISHYCWVSDSRIVVYGRYKEKDALHFFNQNLGIWIYDRSFNIPNKFGGGDTHPIFSKSNNTLILDSYPNIKGFQYLYQMRLDSGEFKLIDKVYHSLKFNNSTRVDLHPKSCPLDDSLISIDTVNSGIRQIYFYSTHYI